MGTMERQQAARDWFMNPCLQTDLCFWQAISSVQGYVLPDGRDDFNPHIASSSWLKWAKLDAALAEQIRSESLHAKLDPALDTERSIREIGFIDPETGWEYVGFGNWRHPDFKVEVAWRESDGSLSKGTSVFPLAPKTLCEAALQAGISYGVPLVGRMSVAKAEVAVPPAEHVEIVLNDLRGRAAALGYTLTRCGVEDPAAYFKAARAELDAVQAVRALSEHDTKVWCSDPREPVQICADLGRELLDRPAGSF